MTDFPVTPARDTQCASCSHWRRQGGLVLEATMRCASLDDAQMDTKARLIVVAMARTLAREGACPTYEAPETYPDSYRSADLPAARLEIHEEVTRDLDCLSGRAA